MGSLTSLLPEDKIRMASAADILTVDTEVVPLHGISICFDGLQEGFYFPIAHQGTDKNLSPNDRDNLYRVIENAKARVYHNAAHDIDVLEQAGISVADKKFYDTMLMAHWINEEMFNYSLDSVSKAYGGQPKEMPAVMKDLIASDGWEAVPVGMMSRYSGHDAFITHELFRKLKPEFEKQQFEQLWEFEEEFIVEVMIPMMKRGIKLNMEFCIKEFMRGSAIMEEIKKELKFNPNSPKDLERILINELGLPVLNRTKTGRVSFTKAEMERYDVLLSRQGDERAKKILTYRGWLKTVSSNYKPYIDLVNPEGFLNPGYKLHGTKTGRLSCEKPNLQQIPKSSDNDWNGGLKEAFIAREGFSLWTIDYSQLQFRMFVAYVYATTQDETIKELIEIFNDPTRDIFSEMASNMGWPRDDVKTLVYLILFGGGGKRAQEAFGLHSEVEGKEIVDEFHNSYNNSMRVTAKECEKAAKRQGLVTYWTGRRRHFPRRWLAGRDVTPYYRAMNAIIQGGEAEIIKRALVRLNKLLCDENCFTVLQIHDEVAFEIRNGMEDRYLPKAQQIMEEAAQPFCEFVGVDIHFKTSIGRWGEK